MRAVVMHEPGNVTVEDMPMPSILEPTDAIIKLAATCICGSDLWPYRGAQPVHERRMGHEYVGTVTEVGSASQPSSPATSSSVPSAFPAVSAKSAAPDTPRAARPPPPKEILSSARARAAPRPSTLAWPSRTAPW